MCNAFCPFSIAKHSFFLSEHRQHAGGFAPVRWVRALFVYEITTVIFSEGLEKIGVAFYNSASTSITIGNTVSVIESSTFDNCQQAVTLTIGSGVTSIGNEAFIDIVRLNTITILAEVPPTLCTDVFKNVPSTAIIYVPADSVDLYKTADGWAALADRIQAIS